MLYFASCRRSSIWLEHSPVTGEVTGSSPAACAKKSDLYTIVSKRTFTYNVCMHVIEETETVSLDEYLVKNKEATYMLRVVGNNLNEHGIYEGDMILVERGRAPSIGDMVIAWSSTGFIMKKYKIINGTESLRSEAVVIAVIRKYE